MEGNLTFGVLGPLAVTRGDEPIELPRRKERQILAALLLDANRTVTTDRLIDAAWGDEPPAKPLTSLRSCISNLRKTIPPGADGEHVLATEPGGYQLRCGPNEIDAGRFEHLLAEARSASAAGEAERAATLLDEGLALVRGEPLADMAYDEFAQREIARLAELVIGGEELRAQVALDLGQAEHGLTRIAELVAAHPLRERLQAIHMTALYRLGRQAEALRSYQTHRQAIIDELGIEPAAELQELEARILAQDPTLDQAAPTSDPNALAGAPASEPDTDRRDGGHSAVDDATPPASPAETAGGPVRASGVVGRAAQLAVLDGLAADAPGVGFVIGDSGSGKSTLVEAFLDHLDTSGWRIAHGLCLDDDGVPPLWPWRQVLRDLGLASAVSLAASDEINRFDLIDDLASTLVAAADAGPVAVFLDDLQWADDDTLRLVAHISRRVRAERLLIVAAARKAPPELSRTAGTWIELDDLTVEDIAALVELKTGQPCDPGLAADLWERTGGNAYFVTELIDFARHFADEVRPDLEIPSHVRELVRQRVRVLPPDTAELLAVASLEVQNFSPEIIAAVVGRQPDEVLAALQPAIDAGVIRPDRNAYGRFRFDHAITRETLEADIEPNLAAANHAALGRSLLARAGDNPEQHASALSRHFANGAPAGTAAEAVHWATIAAEQAAATWSHRDALVHLRRAIAAESHLPAPDLRQRCGTLLTVGRYSRVIAEVDEAEEALLSAFRIADELDDAELLATVALELAEGMAAGHWRWYWNPGTTATSAMRQALDRLPSEDGVLRATVMAQLAADSYQTMALEERTALLDEALAMVERVGNPSEVATIRHFRRSAIGWTWGPAAALEHDREVLATVTEHGHEAAELRLRTEVMNGQLTTGDLAGVHAAVDDIRSQARLRGSLTWRFFLTQWEILLDQIAGRYDEANARAVAALDPVTGLGEDFENAIFNQMQTTHHAQGRFDTVAETLEAGTHISDRLLFSRGLINTLCLAGRFTEAEERLATIDPLLPDIDQIGGRLVPALSTEALALLRPSEALDAGLLDTGSLNPGLLDRAIDYLLPAADELALGSPGFGGLVYFGPIRYFIAIAMVARGRLDEAEDQIRQARALMTAIEAAPMLLRLDYLDAEILAAKRGLAAAAPRFDELRTAANDSGTGIVVALIDLAIDRGRPLSEP